LKATEQPIDTSTAAGKCFLDMLGVFAEFETNLRRERQLEGIAMPRRIRLNFEPNIDHIPCDLTGEIAGLKGPRPAAMERKVSGRAPGLQDGGIIHADPIAMRARRQTAPSTRRQACASIKPSRLTVRSPSMNCT
jgi:Resolvase, N terminal domain